MSKFKTFSNANVSLTPQIFYILLALATKELHGYDIMKQVENDSNGNIKLGPGTLYGAIKRMLDEKLLIEVKSTHTRRKYYKLTEKGMALFSKELGRYNNAVVLAKKRKLFVSPLVARLVFAYV